MPKPSSNPDKARQGGGVEAGVYEVISAEFRNHKTDYKPTHLALMLETAPCDKDGDKVRGADPVTIPFSLGDKSLEAFHPGMVTGPHDADPQDQGTETDAAGNSVFCEGSEQFNKSCGFVVFMESLAKLGYPKDIMEQTYAPNLVGLKFDLETLAGPDVNTRLGTRLSTKPLPDGGNATYKIAKRWLNPNYLANTNGNGTGAAKGKGTTAAAAEKAPAAEKAATGAGQWKDKSAEELAHECLRQVAEMRQGEKGIVRTHMQLTGLGSNQYSKSKMPSDKLKSVQALFKDAAWAKAAVAKAGGMWGTEPRQVVFGEASEAEQMFDDDGNPV